MSFPTQRLRRTRRREALRRMVKETKLSADDLIFPMFVVHGNNIKNEIKSLPGNYHLSIDNLIKDAEEIVKLKIPAVILFGLPASKDEVGSEAYASDGIVQQAVRALKSEMPDLIVITDVCLCEYTTHGHCGIVENGYIVNDLTLELIAKTALSHAEAGSDIVAPAGMMDGSVQAIRKALDEKGFHETLIMSYSAKYASNLYAPFFRNGTRSIATFGDKKSYQMDYANTHEALREVALDIEEGADIVMVKPALPYLDIIYRVKQKFGVPVAAYNVSGEYAMIKAAGEKGWINADEVMMEVLTCIKRGSADIIITYFAKQAAGLLLDADRQR